MQDEPQPLSEDQVAGFKETPAVVTLAPSQVFSIRLNAGEVRALAREARRVNLTVGAFVKKAALHAAEVHRFSSAAPIQFGIGGDGEAHRGIGGSPRVSGSAGNANLVFRSGEGYVRSTAR